MYTMLTRKKLRESMNRQQVDSQDCGDGTEYETTYESESDLNDRQLDRTLLHVETDEDDDIVFSTVGSTGDNKHAGILNTSEKRGDDMGLIINECDEVETPMYNVPTTTTSMTPVVRSQSNVVKSSINRDDPMSRETRDQIRRFDEERAAIQRKKSVRVTGYSDVETSGPSDAETTVSNATVIQRPSVSISRNQATSLVEQNQPQIVRFQSSQTRSENLNSQPHHQRYAENANSGNVGNMTKGNRSEMLQNNRNVGNRVSSNVRPHETPKGSAINANELLQDPNIRTTLIQALMREENSRNQELENARNAESQAPRNLENDARRPAAPPRAALDNARNVEPQALRNLENEVRRNAAPQRAAAARAAAVQQPPVQQRRIAPGVVPTTRYQHGYTTTDTGTDTDDSSNLGESDREYYEAGYHEVPQSDARLRQHRHNRRAIENQQYYDNRMKELPPSERRRMMNEYASTGRVLLRHKLPGDERKYWDEEFMDSPATDAPSDYSTEQEDIDVALRKLRGFGLPGENTEFHFTPMRKLQRARKYGKQTLKQMEIRYRRPDSIFEAPLKPFNHEQKLGAIAESERRANQTRARSRSVSFGRTSTRNVSESVPRVESELRAVNRASENTSPPVSTNQQPAAPPAAKTSSITLAPGIVLTTTDATVEPAPNNGTHSTTINIVGQSGRKGGSGDFRIPQPVFNGGNWATFKLQFDRVAQYWQWNDEQKATALHLAIKDKAADALSSADTINWSYAQLVRHMEERHGKTKSWSDVFPEAMKIRRRPGQSLTAYNDAIMTLLNSAKLEQDEFRNLAFNAFVHGLQVNPIIVKKIHAAGVNTIEAALDIAKRYEAEGGDPYYGLPNAMHVHMVGDADDDTRTECAANQQPAQANNNRNSVTTQVASMETANATNNVIASGFSQVTQQLQHLGDRVDKRFDAFDRRVRVLEGRPAPPPTNRYDNKNKFTNPFNGDNRRNGFQNAGNAGFRDERKAGPNGPGPQNNQNRGRNDGYRGGSARNGMPQDIRRTQGGDARAPPANASGAPAPGGQSRRD